jgi:hypothetical protein
MQQERVSGFRHIYNKPNLGQWKDLTYGKRI